MPVHPLLELDLSTVLIQFLHPLVADPWQRLQVLLDSLQFRPLGKECGIRGFLLPSMLKALVSCHSTIMRHSKIHRLFHTVPPSYGPNQTSNHERHKTVIATRKDCVAHPRNNYSSHYCYFCSAPPPGCFCFRTSHKAF